MARGESQVAVQRHHELVVFGNERQGSAQNRLQGSAVSACAPAGLGYVATLLPGQQRARIEERRRVYRKEAHIHERAPAHEIECISISMRQIAFAPACSVCNCRSWSTLPTIGECREPAGRPGAQSLAVGIASVPGSQIETLQRNRHPPQSLRAGKARRSRAKLTHEH